MLNQYVKLSITVIVIGIYICQQQQIFADGSIWNSIAFKCLYVKGENMKRVLENNYVITFPVNALWMY